MARPITVIALLGGAVALAAGSAIAGRLSAPPDSTGYIAGFQDGAAQGRMEGRALQESPDSSAARAVFLDGYAAGADDVFAGYDGGWALSQPYVVTLKRAQSPVTYRIASRVPMVEGVTYVRCGDNVCEGPDQPSRSPTASSTR